ncbi:MAG TPA: 2-oxo-4-hydroxy-4-carboxy-5-ureidoimidazoline decarboxylase [Stellaceae bacterium]|nr:2-oxo-4-hydroxy-4-carboxy-5-ureidoimidazoline decarboxylase [Stellaceae bacterium]
MAEPEAVPLPVLNALGRAAFVALLGNVYEHAPWAAEAVWPRRPFATVAAVLAALGAAVRAASPETQSALVRGHPDLAGKAARAGAVTRESAEEQGSAGLDRLTDEEFAAFHRLSDAYRARFSHPFIICVRRHTRDSILDEFARRLGNAPEAERAAALAEIDRIAALRLAALVTGPGPVAVNGQLSTHVLDTERGVPAAGVGVELRELRRAGDHRAIWQGATNASGRTEAPLVAGRPVPIGRYELAFAVGAYFARRGSIAADPPFLDIVPVRFAVAEAEGHYHVPLLMTPWSYTTYRGS